MKKSASKKPTRKKPKDPNKYPRGWNRERVQRVLEHYENQTDEEQAAEIEAAFNSAEYTMVAVPNHLVPDVLKLLEKKRPK